MPKTCSTTLALPLSLDPLPAGHYGLLAERQPAEPWLQVPSEIAGVKDASDACDRALAFARLLQILSDSKGQPATTPAFGYALPTVGMSSCGNPRQPGPPG